MDTDSNVTSLAERRRQKNRQVRQTMKTDAIRLQELEVEVVKLADTLLDVHGRLEAQERHLKSLIGLLKKYTESPIR